MDSRSWQRLAPESPQHRLPDDLRARDPMGGRDCGWVEQMRPFVRHFSRPGDGVFDPFAGFGTTLLAAHLEGRRAIGCEVDAARVALIGERLARHGADAATVLHGSCVDIADARLPPFDLCLTSVPYFGCRWGGEPEAAQLYASDSYAAHLDGLRDVFHRVRAGLRDGGHCIAMVENVRLGERCLPLAFDLARILGALFTLQEERILVYDRLPASTPVAPTQTDRSHEYALVFRKERARIDLAATAALLDALRADGHEFELIGSFAHWLRDPTTRAPADADIRVAADGPRIDTLLRWLAARGFSLTSWGDPVVLPLHMAAYAGRHYFRADRIDRQGGLVRLDIGYTQAL